MVTFYSEKSCKMTYTLFFAPGECFQNVIKKPVPACNLIIDAPFCLRFLISILRTKSEASLKANDYFVRGKVLRANANDYESDNDVTAVQR